MHFDGRMKWATSPAESGAAEQLGTQGGVPDAGPVTSCQGENCSVCVLCCYLSPLIPVLYMRKTGSDYSLSFVRVMPKLMSGHNGTCGGFCEFPLLGLHVFHWDNDKGGCWGACQVDRWAGWLPLAAWDPCFPVAHPAQCLQEMTSVVFINKSPCLLASYRVLSEGAAADAQGVGGGGAQLWIPLVVSLQIYGERLAGFLFEGRSSSLSPILVLSCSYALLWPIAIHARWSLSC